MQYQSYISGFEIHTTLFRLSMIELVGGIGRVEVSIWKRIKKVGRLALKGAESTTARVVGWILVGVSTSVMIIFSLMMLAQAITGSFDWTYFGYSSIVLTIVIVLTNVLIIFRSEHQAYDPWIDLRNHARIQTKLGKNESNFLLMFHRTGYPIELGCSYRSTLNRIERSVPNILLFVGLGTSLAIFGFSFIYVNYIYYSIRLTDFIVFCIIFLVGLFQFEWAINKGVLERWNDYRTWKEFWTSYWEFILNILEPTPYASDIPECIGDWDSLVSWRWWGERVEISNPEFLEDLRNECGKLINKLELSDSLPNDTHNFVEYCDLLALFRDIKEYLKEHKDEIAEVVKKSNDYKDIIDRLSSQKTLVGETRENLRSSFLILKLLPVVALSFEAFNEIREISRFQGADRTEIYELAKSRLELLWFLPGSPIPDSLKWTAVFYSIASLVATWLSPL